LLLTPYEQDYSRVHDGLLLTDQEHSIHDHHDTFHELLIGVSDSHQNKTPHLQPENATVCQMLEEDDLRLFYAKL